MWPNNLVPFPLFIRLKREQQWQARAGGATPHAVGALAHAGEALPRGERVLAQVLQPQARGLYRFKQVRHSIKPFVGGRQLFAGAVGVVIARRYKQGRLTEIVHLHAATGGVEDTREGMVVGHIQEPARLKEPRSGEASYKDPGKPRGLFV